MHIPPERGVRHADAAFPRQPFPGRLDGPAVGQGLFDLGAQGVEDGRVPFPTGGFRVGQAFADQRLDQGFAVEVHLSGSMMIAPSGATGQPIGGWG